MELFPSITKVDSFSHCIDKQLILICDISISQKISLGFYIFVYFKLIPTINTVSFYNITKSIHLFFLSLKYQSGYCQLF